MAFERVVRGFLVAIVLASGVIFSSIAVAGNSIVAKVGGIPVTVYEVERLAQKIMPMRFHGELPQEKVVEIRAQALGQLIEQAYKVRYALAEEIAIDNAELEKRIAALEARFKSPEEFEKATGDEGLEAFRATIYRELLAKKAERVAVDSKVNVTEEEVRAYYDENKSDYFRPIQFKASQILIKVDPASNEEELESLRKKAEDLSARAKAGEDFYNLAYYNSDDPSRYVGGDTGYFHKGQFMKSFEDAVLQMKVGEISAPVRSRYGFHIINLKEVNEAQQLDFEDVKVKIRQSLEKKRRDALYTDWIGALKNQYKVERFDK